LTGDQHRSRAAGTCTRNPLTVPAVRLSAPIRGCSRRRGRLIPRLLPGSPNPTSLEWPPRCARSTSAMSRLRIRWLKRSSSHISRGSPAATSRFACSPSSPSLTPSADASYKLISSNGGSPGMRSATTSDCRYRPRYTTHWWGVGGRSACASPRTRRGSRSQPRTGRLRAPDSATNALLADLRHPRADGGPSTSTLAGGPAAGLPTGSSSASSGRQSNPRMRLSC
jgi:hypothetical protein